MSRASVTKRGAGGVPKRKAVSDVATLGVLPDRELKEVVQSGAISAEGGVLSDQLQPASLDLRLGKVAYRLRAV